MYLCILYMTMNFFITQKISPCTYLYEKLSIDAERKKKLTFRTSLQYFLASIASAKFFNTCAEKVIAEIHYIYRKKLI